MKILTTCCSKGGSGKTTTAAALAQAGAADKKKILLIDLDPQCSLTKLYGIYSAEQGSSLTLIEEGYNPDQIMADPGGSSVKIIPAVPDLAAAHITPGSAQRLKTALEALKGQYDLIIIDSPPGAGELQYNALIAATGQVIPVRADRQNLEGLYQTIEIADHIKQYNPGLKQYVLITDYDGRPTVARTFKQAIEETAKQAGIPFIGIVRRAAALQEAQDMQVSLYEYAPRSNPAQDYREVYKKVMQRRR